MQLKSLQRQQRIHRAFQFYCTTRLLVVPCFRLSCLVLLLLAAMLLLLIGLLEIFCSCTVPVLIATTCCPLF
jgi:hypothetical protein